MTFRAVQWVRDVRDRNHQETKNMTFEQRLRFYKSRGESARARISQLKRASQPRKADT